MEVGWASGKVRAEHRRNHLLFLPCTIGRHSGWTSALDVAKAQRVRGLGWS